VPLTTEKTEQYITLQYNAVLYNTVLCCAVLACNSPMLKPPRCPGFAKRRLPRAAPAHAAASAPADLRVCTSTRPLSRRSFASSAWGRSPDVLAVLHKVGPEVVEVQGELHQEPRKGPQDVACSGLTAQ